MVVEYPGDRACEGFRVDVPVDVAHLQQDLVETVDDPGEQLTGHLASTVHGPEDLLGFPVEPAAELGDLVPGAGPVVCGDRGYRVSRTDRTRLPQSTSCRHR